MKNNKKVLNQYSTFLSDFGFDYKNWDQIYKVKQSPQSIPVPRQDGEGDDHYRAKRRIVELFRDYNEKHDKYLIWSEREQEVERYVPQFDGMRAYCPDILLFDKLTPVTHKKPYCGIYIIEIDGRINHTSSEEIRKAKIRDNFFWQFYHVTTTRLNTWRCFGRKAFYLEAYDVIEEMMFKFNEFSAVIDNN